MNTSPKKENTYLNVNGFEIGVLIEDWKVYVQADDTARYFGYKGTSSGRVNGLYVATGIGNIPKVIRYDGNGVQRLYFDKHGVTDFRNKSKKDPYIVQVKATELVREMQKISPEKPALTTVKPTRKPPTVTPSYTHLQDKFKITEVSTSGNKLVATFETGRYTTTDIDSSFECRSKVHTGKPCALSGNAIEYGNQIYRFESRNKGYGTYIVLKSAIEGLTEEAVKEQPVEKSLWEKLVGWFKKDK